MEHTSIEKVILSILRERDLPLTIGVITHRVRKRIGRSAELRKQVRTAVDRLFTAQKIDRVYMSSLER